MKNANTHPGPSQDSNPRPLAAEDHSTTPHLNEVRTEGENSFFNFISDLGIDSNMQLQQNNSPKTKVQSMVTDFLPAKKVILKSWIDIQKGKELPENIIRYSFLQHTLYDYSRMPR